MGPAGAAGPTGAIGPSGTAGDEGPRGIQGVPGRDGMAVAMRARSTAATTTPLDGSPAQVPLSGAGWTQRADELDFGPVGQIVVKDPDASTCGGSGFALLSWVIKLDGSGNLALGTLAVSRDGQVHTFRIDQWNSLLEPGVDTSHTMTAQVSSVCESGPIQVSMKVEDFRFDLLGAT